MGEKTTDWTSRVLVVAPHADDETLGCGGLIAQLTRAGRDVRVLVLTLGRTPPSPKQQTTEELHEACRGLGLPSPAAVLFPGYQGRLDTLPISDVITALDSAIADFEPTAVFFPYASHHQDHEVTYRATIAALRPRELTSRIRIVAMYEYPYAATWPPPTLVGGKMHRELSTQDLDAKVAAYGQYKTQHSWITPERVRLWAVGRGAEVGVEAAEAFWVLRGWL
jgi:LmbE family N-acetylglucosaminyl deacetylase